MHKPPPVIHSAKLLTYAFNDSDVIFTNKIHLYVGGVSDELVRLCEMPNLAICLPYNDPSEYLLFLCDCSWEPKRTINGVSLEDVKNEANRGYNGISEKWQNSSYTQDETDEYLREKYEINPNTRWWETICSFCGKGKNDSEAEQMLSGNTATICDKCIRGFHEIITEQNV